MYIFLFFIVLIVLFIILRFAKNYYSYEYFAVKSCDNSGIFKSINNVSKDITDLKYSLQNQLAKKSKYVSMYNWYLSQTGNLNKLPICGKEGVKNVKAADNAAKKSIKQSFVEIKDKKPKTKAAAKNRKMLNNAIMNSSKGKSDDEIREEWVKMVSGKAIGEEECPTRNGFAYPLLVQCSKGKTRFNSEEKEELERVLDDDIKVKYCKKKLDKCNTIIDRSIQVARNEVIKYSIPQLKQSIKNMKKKSMNDDIKEQGIPDKFV